MSALSVRNAKQVVAARPGRNRVTSELELGMKKMEPIQKDPLELKFHRAVLAHFTASEVIASEVCVAAAGVMSAYLAALPSHESRVVLLDRVIAVRVHQFADLGSSVLVSAKAFGVDPPRA
jgi:hypothetical protein